MHILKIALLILVVTLLQLTLIGRFEILGARADLALIFTVYFAISRGEVVGTVIGFASGIASELFSSAPLGMETFGKIVVGYVIGSLSKRLYVNFLATQLICNFLAVIGEELLILMMLNLNLKSSMDNLFELAKFRHIFLPEALLNAALSPILFAFLSKIFDKSRGVDLNVQAGRI